MEKNLADSHLHQWFCYIGNFALITSPGKSTIDRYKNWYDQEQLRQAFGIVLQKAAADETHYDVVLEEAVNILGFEIPSDLSEAQAAVVISRIKGVIENIPQAIEQAHERIIGERRVAPADKLLEEALRETSVNTGMPVGLMCWDRGFGNKEIQRDLAEKDPARKDHIASKSLVEFNEQMEDSEFRESQQRRAQTEGRIGIIKNVFTPLRSVPALRAGCLPSVGSSPPLFSTSRPKRYQIPLLKWVLPWREGGLRS